MSTAIFILGQIFGIITVILGFLSYQTKNAKSLLVFQIATCAVFCAHYLCLNAWPAFFLNAVGTVRNITYYKKEKLGIWANILPWVFAAVMAILGILSWNGWYSIFIVAGLVINTLCLNLKEAQSIRWSILVTSPMVFTYDAFVMAIGGMIYEAVAIASAIIGIVRHKNCNEVTK
ncbi:MAG: YgjV family protein [Clostridia bacterium]|nr:YgjV family protein [Clostridia bacterium]